jgi:hypothetical protein
VQALSAGALLAGNSARPASRGCRTHVWDLRKARDALALIYFPCFPEMQSGASYIYNILYAFGTGIRVCTAYYV